MYRKKRKLEKKKKERREEDKKQRENKKPYQCRWYINTRGNENTLNTNGGSKSVNPVLCAKLKFLLQ